MKVLCVESFEAKTQNGKRTVRKGEKLTVISGFGFLRLKTWRGQILHCKEEYLGSKLVEAPGLLKKEKQFFEKEEFNV